MMKRFISILKRQREEISSALFIAVISVFILSMLLLSSCTDYERAGINPRPFNEPASWEINPYGDAFHN